MAQIEKAPHDLLIRRIGALYATNAEGRLVCSNEWDRRIAPRFHLMRTASGSICRFRSDLPDLIVRRLSALCTGENSERAPESLPAKCDQYLEILGGHAPVEKVWSGPAYMFVQHVDPARPPVAIDASNAELLRGHFDDWLPDVQYRQPFMALVEDGHAVALCASVRISSAVHCAGVETHRDHRRRGHATAVVAGWAQAVRSLGATPFYSTSWENAASQRIAARLGFRMVAVDFSIT